MNRILKGLGFATLLTLAFNAGPAHAQTTAATTTSAIPLRYDVSKEVTFSATVQSVPSKSSGGLLHSASTGFVLQTTAGTVQGRLTYAALNGKGALSITPGQHVLVTGVMTTTNNKQVFLIRTIQMGSRSYTIRNEHGFPVAPNASTATESNGGQL
jgi:hypothetical protein